MTTEDRLDKDTFYTMAKVAGLDVDDTAHMDELYSYVRSVIPGLSALDDLDLSAVEPATVYLPPAE
jgi:hypothetical protein